MFIRKITNETLLVRRGEDGTQALSHIQGSIVDVVNAADDALIEVGDDFGFSEERFDLDLGKTYSPSKGTDV